MPQSDTRIDGELLTTLLHALTVLRLQVNQNPACGVCQRMNALTKELSQTLYDHTWQFSTPHIFSVNATDQGDSPAEG